MVDLVVPAITDLPTPSSGFKTMVWRGVALYQLDAGYWPLKDSDGRWVFDKANTTGSSNAAIRMATNGNANSGGYLGASSAECWSMLNCEFITGTGWVARATTASFMRMNAGNTEFYANVGLTVGATFSPTLRFTINGTTGAITVPGGGASITGNSTVTGTFGATGNTLIGGTLTVVPTTGWAPGASAAAFVGDSNNGFSSAFGGAFNVSGYNGVDFYMLGTVKQWSLTTTSFVPATDNTRSICSASLRANGIFATTGIVSTSDEREKRWRGALTADELRAAKRIAKEIGVYQWLDALAEKGEAARLHTGVRAQRAFAILKECGLDWRRYAWCCHDKWEDQYEDVLETVQGPSTIDDDRNEIPGAFSIVVTGQRLAVPAGDRYGVRPDQLAMFLIAAQEQRLAVLEAALA